MASEKPDDGEFSVAASTTSTAGNSDFQHYLKIYLPLERSTEFTKEEQDVIQAVIKVVGEEPWNALSLDQQLNIIRGNAHEKERLKVTCGSVKQIYEWRKQFNVDRDALTLGPWPGFDKYISAWPTRVAGCDVFGHPIIYDRFLAVDTARLMAFDDGELLKLRTQALEALYFLKREISAKIGSRVGKQIYILDLAGFDTTKHFTAATQKKMKPVMKMSADMFPETLWTTWIINAPPLFRFVWTTIRTWLDPVIRAKIRMFGPFRAKWQAAMADCGIPLSALPAEFGGTAPSESLEDILLRAAVQNSKIGAD